MEGEQRIEFPLDLTCPACQATPVTVGIVTTPRDQTVVDVDISCPCGQKVNYGTLPVRIANE